MVKKWQEPITIAAGVVTILGLGFGVGAKVSDEKKEILRDENIQLEKKVADLEGEVRTFKEDEANLVGEIARLQAGPANPASTADPAEPPANDKLRKITVARGDTGEVVGELSISVPAITVAYKPFRYVVSVRVNGPGSPTTLSKELNLGDRFNFGSYEVRLLSADLNKARFALQKL